MTDAIPSYPRPMAERVHRWIKQKTVVRGECWIWTGGLDRNGYGHVNVLGRTRTVHRMFYEFFRGEVSEDLEMDHLCRVRNCVNPFHLEAVTHKVNMERAIGVGQYDRSHLKGRRRTHCPHGHAMVDENLYIRGNRRACRTCSIDRAKANYQKRKAAASGDQ